MRRTAFIFFNNVSGESPSFRAKPSRSLVLDVANSPYKEQFKDYWATPMPWAQREYGAKPKIGDPVPLRNSASTIVIGKNNHLTEEEQAAVDAGDANDYKVLMMFRQSRGRFTKDQFIIPSSPIHALDRDRDFWDPVFARRGFAHVRERFPTDHEERMCALRSLLVETNMLLIPKEGGSIAEVQGPPGPKKWHMMVMEAPKAFRDLIDALELPLEKCYENLIPFRRVQTPKSETFRFDNRSFIVPIKKIPCVKYTISTVGEQLVWVSPREALERFNDGRMEMPTPNLILLSELARSIPKFSDIETVLTPKNYGAESSSSDNMDDLEIDLSKQGPRPLTLIDREPEVICPELVRDPARGNMATVILPGDLHHEDTPEEEKQVGERFFHRFHYEKDWPHGVKAVFVHRPVEEGADDTAPLVRQPHALIDEINEADEVYMHVEREKRSFNPANDGKTTMPYPDHHLQDGPVNREGFIDLRAKKQVGR